MQVIEEEEPIEEIEEFDLVPAQIHNEEDEELHPNPDFEMDVDNELEL